MLNIEKTQDVKPFALFNLAFWISSFAILSFAYAPMLVKARVDGEVELTPNPRKQ